MQATHYHSQHDAGHSTCLAPEAMRPLDVRRAEPIGVLDSSPRERDISSDVERGLVSSLAIQVDSLAVLLPFIASLLAHGHRPPCATPL
jgi:hypothetical protein